MLYFSRWRRTSSLLGDSDSVRDDGDDEFDPLLEDEEEDEEEEEARRMAIVKRGGGQELLYIGSLKVPGAAISRNSE